MGCASSAPEDGPKSTPTQPSGDASTNGSARAIPAGVSGVKLLSAPSVDLVKLDQLCARLEAIAAAAHAPATAIRPPSSAQQLHDTEADAADALRALCERLERVAEARPRPAAKRKTSYRI